MENILLFWILIICWVLTVGLLIYIYSKDPVRKNKKFDNLLNNLPVDMSRQQRRLFDKQLSEFKKKFNNFSNYQLKLISDLCIEIIQERK